jgi:hypothetical protein
MNNTYTNLIVHFNELMSFLFRLSFATEVVLLRQLG